MQNPAVIVTVTTTRPTAETPLWFETTEGAALLDVIHQIFQNYDGDIEVTNSVDGLTLTVTVSYASTAVYNNSRADCLAAAPDFLDKRQQYCDANGIVLSHTVTYT